MPLSLNENDLSLHGRMSVAAVTHLFAEVLGSSCRELGLKTESDGTVEITIALFGEVTVDPQNLEFYKTAIAGILTLSRRSTPNIVIKFV